MGWERSRASSAKPRSGAEGNLEWTHELNQFFNRFDLQIATSSGPHISSKLLALSDWNDHFPHPTFSFCQHHQTPHRHLKLTQNSWRCGHAFYFLVWTSHHNHSSEERTRKTPPGQSCWPRRCKSSGDRWRRVFQHIFNMSMYLRRVVEESCCGKHHAWC